MAHPRVLGVGVIGVNIEDQSRIAAYVIREPGRRATRSSPTSCAPGARSACAATSSRTSSLRRRAAAHGQRQGPALQAARAGRARGGARLTRAAIIGAGPAGFYAADQLIKAGLEVDLYDALPTPFGLVRAGVAPDHPKIKSVTRVYTKTAAHPAFRFYGGVRLGEDLSRDDLLTATTPSSTRSGRPPTTGSGSRARTGRGRIPPPSSSHGTTAIPSTPTRRSTSACERAVVIGNGNVAIDVARMLVLDPGELAGTDTADHAIEGFAGRACATSCCWRRGPARRRSRTRSCASSASSRGRTSWSTPRSSRASPSRRTRRAGATSRSCATTRSARAGQVPQPRAALPALAGRDPRRGRRRAGDGRVVVAILSHVLPISYM